MKPYDVDEILTMWDTFNKLLIVKKLADEPEVVNTLEFIDTLITAGHILPRGDDTVEGYYDRVHMSFFTFLDKRGGLLTSTSFVRYHAQFYRENWTLSPDALALMKRNVDIRKRIVELVDAYNRILMFHMHS